MDLTQWNQIIIHLLCFFMILKERKKNFYSWLNEIACHKMVPNQQTVSSSNDADLPFDIWFDKWPCLMLEFFTHKTKNKNFKQENLNTLK